MSRFVAVYVTPPAVFVAVLIGGGYGTGREVVEFFSRHGTLGGLLGIGVATALFATIFGLTFDFARQTRSYEYVAFFRALIGRFWWAFEVLYLLLALLVLGVLSAAAGDMLNAEYAVAGSNGLLLALVAVGVVVFFGRAVLERILTGWTVAMYGVFAAYFYFVFQAEPGDSAQAGPPMAAGTAVAGGALYVMYNAAIAPVLLFAVRGIETRREALLSGLTTAVVLMVPAMLFHVSFSGSGLPVLEEAVPVYRMIEEYTPTLFRSLFVLALLGTLIQTGAGLIHGFIERVEHALFPERDDAMRGPYRLAIAVAALTGSWLLAQFGIIALIAQGYTSLGVGFALIYVLPLLARQFIPLRVP